MPRPYQTGSAGGTSMTGHTYEPHVTPWNRDDDDFNVTGQRSANREPYRSGQYGPDERYREQHDQSRFRSDREQDPYYRRDLKPSYGDRGDYNSRDERDRYDRDNRGRPERDYAHDYDRDRSHWQNFGDRDRDDYRPRQSDERRYDDNRRFDERYEVRGRFDKDYNRDHDDRRDTRSADRERDYRDDPWRSAYPRR
jgi:hypothetical protein